MYGLWYPYTGISIPRGGAYKDLYPKYLESVCLEKISTIAIISTKSKQDSKVLSCVCTKMHGYGVYRKITKIL